MFRYIGLYCEYLINIIKYRGVITFNGFTIIHAFKGSRIIFKGSRHVINSSKLSNLIGLYQRTIIVARRGGSIVIGDNVGISGSTIYANNDIKVGNNVLIGGNCKIIDNDFHPLNVEDRVTNNAAKINSCPIEIGDGCFIGANSIILKGTFLGKNCVVGAGSVVHGKWPDNSIIAGNPAKIIGRN